MKKLKNNFSAKDKKGFTLLETLVVMTALVIILTGFLRLFLSAMEEQSKNISRIRLLSSSSYLAEYMTRALRMAVKGDDSGLCVGVYQNYNLLASDSIQFLRKKPDTQDIICQRFFLDGSELKVAKSVNKNPPGAGQGIALNPSDISVDNLEFVVSGDGQAGLALTQQPAVTFAIKLNVAGADIEALKFQTSVSQRELDIPY